MTLHNVPPTPKKEVIVIYRAKPMLKGALLMGILAAMTVGMLLPWLTVFQPWMHVGMSIVAMVWLGYSAVTERFACEAHNRLEHYRLMFKHAKVIDDPAQLAELAEKLKGEEEGTKGDE